MKTCKKKTILKGEVKERLISIISLCDAADLSEKESLTLINNGSLGNQKRTQEHIEKGVKPEPLEITRPTYYKYKKIVSSADFQSKHLYQYAKAGFMKDCYKVKKLLDELMKRSFKNLLLETDPVKNQQIINGITRNIVYYTNFDDVLKRMIEHKKIPTMKDFDPEPQ